MDKVIIDGVDVSECEYANACDKKIKCVILQDDVCEIDPYCEGCNCYYKQLKRLEQENERLKNKNNDLIEEIASGNIDITILQAENKRLKEENERLKSIVESNNQQVEQAELLVMDNDRLQQEIENLKDTIYYDVEKYSQALQEIRDIAEKEIVCDNCNFEGTDKCDARMCTHFYLNDFSKDILDKINEVIGAEE